MYATQQFGLKKWRTSMLYLHILQMLKSVYTPLSGVRYDDRLIHFYGTLLIFGGNKLWTCLRGPGTSKRISQVQFYNPDFYNLPVPCRDTLIRTFPEINQFLNGINDSTISPVLQDFQKLR